ncbi:MAG: alpha-L-fucosidase [Dysgonamonadaceae bacterium]|jgi:alpha-L-fucosidase|nr:alpha-L-fucosidase [Dysgonamonadaceae bacterium]
MQRSVIVYVLSLAASVYGYSCSSKVQTVKTVEAPAPYGVLPDAKQVEWQQMETYMFVHFGPNTFTNEEWGSGEENPEVFNPTALDCRQWAEIAKNAGMKGIIITAKHHDGFCLWNSKYSEHTVANSRWKDGKGDVLRELSDACREFGIKFGVYLSPWDRNHKTYGTPEYNTVFANMLEEVLGNYGEVFEQWFDGANGEGPNGKKQVYDWALFNGVVRKMQPNAMIFSDVGPDCRWIGNEKGIAGETNWSRLDTEGFTPGLGAPASSALNSGQTDGSAWMPGEADVSIRPGWFYSAETDNKVKSLSKLLDIYYTSVGRNANLLLNVPPNTIGRIHPNDSTRLMEFRAALDKIFKHNLIKNAKVSVSQVRGNSDLFSASGLIDGHYDTYWATDDEVLSGEIIIENNEEITFNRLLLQEYIPLGQRVKRFSVDYWDGTQWQNIDNQTTIGYKRILCFPKIRANKIRVNIEESLACPTISELSIYLDDIQ